METSNYCSCFFPEGHYPQSQNPRLVVPVPAQVGRGCLHADFANKSLGGGVLVGGCVQEETLGTKSRPSERAKGNHC